MRTASFSVVKNLGLGVLLLLGLVPLTHSEPPARGGGVSRGALASPRMEAPHVAPAPHLTPSPHIAPSPIVTSPHVDRFSHGSIRHSDVHVVTPQGARPDLVRPHAEGPRTFESHPYGLAHHDVDVDVNRPRHWHGFAFGARRHRLREGFVTVLVAGIPYFYDDGIYYQQAGDDYQEVYPPVGAEVNQLPDGAMEVGVDDVVYYYAGGAFYLPQGDGFLIVPTPIGAVVPELPPGAVQVTVNNSLAYQFNGVYYQPVFANGVTQYVTFLP